MNRRQLLMLATGASLSGCGFQPVYMPTASGNAGLAQRELAAIQVNLIPDRPGQVLRQALQDRLERSASGVARHYDLAVAFGITGEGIAIQQNSEIIAVRASPRGPLRRIHNTTNLAAAPRRGRIRPLRLQYLAADWRPGR
jgi:LPS-assembly lipoprotein